MADQITFSPQLPNDNDGWFKRHIIEALADLKEGHRDMANSQKEMHRENQRIMEDLAVTISTHEESDQQMFASIRQDSAQAKIDLASVKQDVGPLQKILYGAITLILVAFLTAVITSVIVNQKTNTQLQHNEVKQ